MGALPGGRSTTARWKKSRWAFWLENVLMYLCRRSDQEGGAAGAQEEREQEESRMREQEGIRSSTRVEGAAESGGGGGGEAAMGRARDHPTSTHPPKHPTITHMPPVIAPYSTHMVCPFARRARTSSQIDRAVVLEAGA